MDTLKVIISPSKNPYFNLSLEEFLLLNLDIEKASYLLLYVNEPAVVVGRNQNVFEEVNIKFCLENDIKICRRISGGGTVFHDLGNLNWAVITKQNIKKVNSYEWAVAPLFKALEYLELKPYLTVRNAIEVDGLKVSGQAQFTKKNAMISHGTLLMSSNLEEMQPSIESPFQHVTSSKSSKSVRSKVVNINDLLSKDITLDGFQNILIRDYQKIQVDFSKVNASKLRGEAWIYERSPKFEVKHIINKQELYFQVVKAKIETVRNKNGQILENCPYNNMIYKEFLINYCLR